MSILATVGGSIAASLAARLVAGRAKKPKKVTARPEVDLKKLRKAAIKAGFNPLTVLNATGGRGFVGQENYIARPENNVRAALGDALGAGIRAAAAYDPVAQETARLQRDYWTRKVSGLPNGATGPVQTWTVPRETRRTWNPANWLRENPHRPVMGPLEEGSSVRALNDPQDVPVTLLDGRTGWITRRMARVLDVRAHEQLTAEDMTAIVGEVAEFGNAANAFIFDRFREDRPISKPSGDPYDYLVP